MPERVMRVVPMRLRVILAGFSEAESIAEALSGTLDKAGIDVTVSVADEPLSQLAAPGPGEYYICRYQKLINFLGETDQGGDLAFSDLLDQWMDECRQVLSICQKARRQIALVDEPLLKKAPENLLVKALERLDVDTDKIAGIEIEDSEAGDMLADPVLSILVEAATRTSPSVRQVAELIEAHSLAGDGFSNLRRNVHLEEAFAAYRQYVEGNDLSDEVEELRSKLGGLQAELLVYQENENHFRSEIESLSNFLRKALAEGDLQAEEISALNSKLGDLSEENRMLSETADEQRVEIKALRQKLDESLKAHEDITAENEALGQENMMLRSDRAKLTEEQIRLRGHVSQLAAEISEATKVLETSFPASARASFEGGTGSLAETVENALETLQIKLVRLQAGVQAGAQSAESVTRKLRQAEVERENLKKQKAWAEKEAEMLRQDLEATRNSTSWKVTRPIRVLSGRVGKKPAS